MSTPHEKRVLDMVDEGRISEEEGRRLMGVLERRADGWRVLFDPFDRLA
jgi:polyhydroxyalkanoate synthesis regulator phasin